MTTMRVQHVSIPMPAGGNDEIRKFYGDTLGFSEIVPPAILGRARFVWFQVGEDGHELHCYTMDPFIESQPSQHFCVQVSDQAAVRSTLEAAGYTTKDEPTIDNRPRFATFDPFGNKVEISEIVGQYTAAD